MHRRLRDQSAIALLRYRRERDRRYPGQAGKGALWLGRTGQPLTGPGIDEMLRSLREVPGVDILRAHLFRHRWTHVELASGLNESDVIELGGWATGRQLQLRYGAGVPDLGAGHDRTGAQAGRGGAVR